VSLLKYLDVYVELPVVPFYVEDADNHLVVVLLSHKRQNSVLAVAFVELADILTTVPSV
jgi:hypothetical protein